MAVSKVVFESANGVADSAFQQLLRDHWDYGLKSSPVWATTQGDHRFDDRLSDNSLSAKAAYRKARDGFLSRAQSLDTASMSEADKVSLALFIERLTNEQASDVCEFDLWQISARNTQATAFNELYKRHPLASEEDGRNLLSRYRAIAPSIDTSIAKLDVGRSKKLVASREALTRLVDMLDRQLGQPTSSWTMLEPVKSTPKAWAASFKKEFDQELLKIVGSDVKPAVERYRAFVKDKLLPEARGAGKEGLLALPNGKECYQARIRSHTSLEKTAKEIHEIGLSEIRRIDREIAALGKKLFRSRTLSATLKKLRTDQSLFYETKEEILADANAAVSAAKAKIPNYFGILPKADVEVVPIPDVDAPFTTIAYYWQPHGDGSKPGEYFINTYKPETRPRYEMKVLSFHEAIPGHHLQIAISQERGALPAFRRFGGTTAFVEGWGLYSERLSEEMGLYENDLDRMGVLSFDAWRASRLVVDTGIHALGWTRKKAETFMQKHTALTRENISNEVDRYISTPGQALAYKLGQLEILRLRKEAKKALGEKFDIKEFHDRVLEGGAVSLPVLGAKIQSWIES